MYIVVLGRQTGRLKNAKTAQMTDGEFQVGLVSPQLHLRGLIIFPRNRSFVDDLIRYWVIKSSKATFERVIDVG
jgi:hypothetical protein